MVWKFRRRELPWEVVENISVEPVPIYYEKGDIDILSIGETVICGTYIFDVEHPRGGMAFRNALVFARQQLLQVSANKGFNILLLESWHLTLYRREKQHRVEVKYSGRPARSKKPYRSVPPFIAVLD